MKKNILLCSIMLASLFTPQLIGQNNPETGFGEKRNIPIKAGKSFRAGLSLGLATSPISQQMEDDLKAAGFGDKVNAQYDWLWEQGDDFYPQVVSLPFVGDIAVEGKIGQRVWIGMTAGFDRAVQVKGYDRYTTTYAFFSGTYSIGQFVKMEHKSWYLSPQVSYENPNSRIGFFGGPTLEFHTMYLQMTDRIAIRPPAKIGAVMGMRARLHKNLELFAAYRISGGMRYPEATASTVFEDVTYTSVLPEKLVTPSHFRIGFVFVAQ